MRKISGFMVVILTIFLCCSCYDGREVSETAYVIAVGIDGAGEGLFNYTFQIAAPLSVNNGDDNGKNTSVRNIVLTAGDFYTARNMLNNFLSKRVDMSHLKMIVFAPETDSGAWLRHSRMFVREREIRPHTLLAAAEGTAEEYLKCVNPEFEENTAKYYELMSLRSNNIYAPSAELGDFVDEIKDSGGGSLPLARVLRDGDKNERSELKGMMLFRDECAVGALDGDSAMWFNILKRGIKNCKISVPSKYDTSERLVFSVFVPSVAKYSANTSGGSFKITVRQRLEAKYEGGELPNGYGSYAELYSDFQKNCAESVERLLCSLSRDFGVDALNIGKKFRRNFATYDKMKGFDWNKKFSEAEFVVQMEIGGDDERCL